MSSETSPRSIKPSNSNHSDGKKVERSSKEKQLFDSLEKIAVSAFAGFLVGSFQRFSEFNENPSKSSDPPTNKSVPHQPPAAVSSSLSSPSSSSSPKSSPSASPLASHPSAFSRSHPGSQVSSGVASSVRFDEMASQLVRRGAIFAAVAVIFTGTVESSLLFREKVDTAAYVTAGSLTGLVGSLMLRTGVKAGVRNVVLLSSTCGIYSILEEKFLDASSSSAKSTSSAASTSSSLFGDISYLFHHLFPAFSTPPQPSSPAPSSVSSANSKQTISSEKSLDSSSLADKNSASERKDRNEKK